MSPALLPALLVSLLLSARGRWHFLSFPVHMLEVYKTYGRGTETPNDLLTFFFSCYVSFLLIRNILLFSEQLAFIFFCVCMCVQIKMLVP